jgi:hypothetical protein
MLRHALARLLAVLLFCVVVPLAVTASARADDAPDIVDEHLDEAAAYYGNATGAATLPCTGGCQDLQDDLQHPATVGRDPIPTQTRMSEFDNRDSSLPKVITFGSSVGVLVEGGPATWAFLGGLAIGAAAITVLRPGHQQTVQLHPPVAAFEMSQVQSWVLVDGSNPAWYPTYFGLPNPLPVGAVATGSWAGTNLWQTESGHCNQQGPASIPDHVQEYAWVWNNCDEGQDENGHCICAPVAAHGLKIDPGVLFDPSFDIPGAANVPWIVSVDGSTLTLEQLKTRLQGLLHNDDQYKPLHDWYCAVFGGECRNPRDTYTALPDCTGLLPTVCEQHFRDAGFTGAFNLKHLRNSEAVMEEGAGKVTDIYPTAGTEIPQDQDIDVWINPSPMPVMSQQQLDLADDLEQQNPETVTGTNSKTLSHTCAELAAQAQMQISVCRTTPIFVVGHDATKPAINDRAAIDRYPAWFKLNARTKSANPQWYVNSATPSPGCLTAERFPANAQCDEYPFWSTMQANNGPLRGPEVPGIRWTPFKENQREGSALRKFYSDNDPAVFPWSGCDLDQQALTDTVAVQASGFLTVPMPYHRAVLTMGVCNSS